MKGPRRLIINAEPLGYSARALRVLEAIGEVRSGPYERKDLLAALGKAEALVVRLSHRVDRELLDAAPELRAVVTATTGLDHVDLAAAASRDVAVLSLKGEQAFLESIRATSEHTWALLLALMRLIPSATEHVRRGGWDRDRFKGHELAGRRLGILGLGRIGRAVAEFGQVFQMSVSAYDPYREAWPETIERAPSLRALLEASDVLTVHVPLNEETSGLLGRRELAWMPEGAVLVNTARGAVVDEEALFSALSAGTLAGAALDVVVNEADLLGGSADRRLIDYARGHDNLIVTPHIGGATYESMERTEIFMAEKLRRYLIGEGTS